MSLSSLFTDTLTQKSSIKLVTVASVLIIAISGLVPYAMGGFSTLLLTRATMGIGLGLPAVALLGIAGNISQFISPFVINPAAAALAEGTGMRAGGTEGARLPVASALILILAALLAVRGRGRKAQ